MLAFERARSLTAALRALLAAAVVMLIMIAGAMPGLAQDQPASEFAGKRTQLEAIRGDLKRIETALRSRSPSETELVAARQQIDPATDTLRGLIEDLNPRVDQARQRLDQLGPKGANEGAEVATERAAREKALGDADETVRIARALLVQAEQLATEIVDRRRQLFARALFERSPSILGFELWSSVAAILPADVRATRLLMSDWGSTLVDRFGTGRVLLVGLGLIAAFGLYGFRARALAFASQRLGGLEDSSALRRILASFIHLIAAAAPAVIASVLLFALIDASDLFPHRLEPVIGAVLYGVAGVVAMRALAEALVAPDARHRRVLGVWDTTARATVALAVGTATALAIGKVVEAFLQAIAAGLPLSIAARSVLALAFAATLLAGLRRLRDRGEPPEDIQAQAVGAVEGSRLAPVRVAGWLAAVLIGLSALLGYTAFAWFLSEQVVWSLAIIALVLLLMLLVEEGIREGFERESRLSHLLRANIGLSQRTVRQIGVIGSGLGKLLIGLIAVLLLLAPWGVESNDLVSSLKAAFFGFKVGDVTVSLSSVVVGAALFSLGIVATRSLQNWLEERFLPSTELDLGLRNSIRTGVGYAGFVAATALAFSSMGLSLEKLAIVAGALSVGIGFGLQSVVGNFVSGLILLWERSIRVGDWIVVGPDQGHVRRISVRATEIETFDRSLVILPNASLISGVVKNRVRTDRTGRIVIPVGVRYTAEPEAVRDVLEGCAKSHDGVLAVPPPRAYLLKIGDNMLAYELRCFVPDVEKLMATSSDLHFAIFNALKDKGIEIA